MSLWGMAILLRGFAWWEPANYLRAAGGRLQQ